MYLTLLHADYVNYSWTLVYGGNTFNDICNKLIISKPIQLIRQADMIWKYISQCKRYIRLWRISVKAL